ncbi:hypothetical protein LMC05_10355 [Limosilactobacillus reuteri]|uniref:hypothetical protein n=1 Tax=Limosilactobacillus reuteri TaxID=1598 RepID=UPI001E5BBAA5|nr:hypothetical protein [Limosilactobacillus reuteri]MCC4509350.1 hypothetical protein [Limosilactobacillus reuteri]MCC4509393.1 hypothetical protein [Limosilactobacillus reuteri]
MEIIQWIIQVIVFTIIILASASIGSTYSLDRIQQKKRAKEIQAEQMYRQRQKELKERVANFKFVNYD